MTSTGPSAVVLDLVTAGGASLGTLTLAQLPGSSATIRDRSRDPERVRHAPHVELSEASAYRYSVEAPGEIPAIEPREMLDPDDETLRTGRIRTGEAVGEVRFRVACATDDATLEATARVEVRPAKLSDEAAFRSMLSDLADVAVEVLHQGFAPAAGRFSSEPGASPRLLYQQFALLHARLFDPELDWALARILAHPYSSWRSEVEERPLGTPIKGSSRLARSLTRGVRTLAAPAHAPLGRLPVRLGVERTESTLDNVPNQYVRFVLERWRSIASDALRAAELSLRGATLRRGRTQAQRAIDRLDELLAQPVFREASPLRSFPQGNQVLLKRDGYRQVAAAAAVIESSLGLELDIEDPFLVSRRSIATLYEYWCFVRLATAVGNVCGENRIPELFTATRDGMSLVLKQGRASRLRFEPTVAGRKLRLDLFFNRSFSAGRDSWTRDMRPDASLVVRPIAGSPYEARAAESWMHFDAKYRVDWQETEPFSSDADDDEEIERLGHSKRTDLLKMHAYRDAIRQSAAAYVLFPGDTPRTFRYASEPLPALGAFPLRPDAADSDGKALERFLAGVLAHVANQATRHERARYWEQTAYDGDGADSAVPPAEFLDRPPADTPVLLGYVRGPQRAWVERTGMYNVRSGQRRGALRQGAPELAAALILLYGGAGWDGPPMLYRRVSSWTAMGREELLGLQYPSPGGEVYLCCQIEPILPQPPWLGLVSPTSLLPSGQPTGTPFERTWLDLVLAAQGP